PIHLATFPVSSPICHPPLSLHDALPIYLSVSRHKMPPPPAAGVELEALLPELLERAQQKWEPGFRQDTRQKRELEFDDDARNLGDRKSTRLNSSHLVISYAVLCLKKTTP